MLCEKSSKTSRRTKVFLLLAPTGPGFGVPPAGPGFGAFPQPPAQSYAGGGPAQIPGMLCIRNIKRPRLNQEIPGQLLTNQALTFVTSGC